jgi:hypothetical protein
MTSKVRRSNGNQWKAALRFNMYNFFLKMWVQDVLSLFRLSAVLPSPKISLYHHLVCWNENDNMAANRPSIIDLRGLWLIRSQIIELCFEINQNFLASPHLNISSFWQVLFLMLQMRKSLLRSLFACYAPTFNYSFLILFYISPLLPGLLNTFQLFTLHTIFNLHYQNCFPWVKVAGVRSRHLISI